MKNLSIVLAIIVVGLGIYAFVQKNKIDDLKVEIKDHQEEISQLSGQISNYQTQIDTLNQSNSELKRTILKLAGDLTRESDRVPSN